jgi:virginiamycin B lyase
MRKFALLAGLLALPAMSPAAASAADAPTCSASCIAEYPVPIPVVYNGPFGIAKGLDNDVWFGDQNTIDTITRDGTFTTYPVPSAGAAVGWVERGTDGNMWFTERGTGKIGSIDAAGRITEYAIPTPNNVPQAVLQDPSGAVWFTEQGGNKIGRLDPATGSFTEFAVPTANAGVQGLALGPDGALWFTERNAGKIGRMDTSGPAAAPLQITAGAGRTLWFTESFLSSNGNKIGRLTPFANDQS